MISNLINFDIFNDDFWASVKRVNWLCDEGNNFHRVCHSHVFGIVDPHVTRYVDIIPNVDQLEYLRSEWPGNMIVINLKHMKKLDSSEVKTFLDTIEKFSFKRIWIIYNDFPDAKHVLDHRFNVWMLSSDKLRYVPHTSACRMYEISTALRFVPVKE